MAKKKTEKKEKIEIRLIELDMGTIKLKVKGKTPLLMDKMPDETKAAIVDKQTGVAKGAKKKTRDLKKEVDQAVHRTSKGKIGFPADGFKKGMMECTSFVGDKSFSKKLVSGAVRIINSEDGLIPIKAKKQDILEHNIEHNVKFTPQFHDWSCELVIQYDKNNISAQDIVTLLNYAGFYIGIGSWRPKCRNGGSGEYGMFEVAV